MGWSLLQSEPDSNDTASVQVERSLYVPDMWNYGGKSRAFMVGELRLI